MDWNVAIERNREALRRVLAALVAMAGLGQSAIGSRVRRRPPTALPIARCRLPTAALCPVISTARSCACCARPRPRRGGW